MNKAFLINYNQAKLTHIILILVTMFKHLINTYCMCQLFSLRVPIILKSEYLYDIILPINFNSQQLQQSALPYL